MTVSIKSPTSTTGSIQLNGSDVLTIESDNSVDIDSGTLHVDATNNNVGIGTTAPSTGYGGTISNVKLALKGSGAGGNNGTSTLLMGGDNNHYSYLSSEHTGGGSTYLAFGTANGAANPTERMRIDSSGRVSINSTTTTSGLSAQLFVKGNGSSGQYGIGIGYGTSALEWRVMYMNSGDGTLYFHNGNNYATLSSAGAWTNASDERLKNNIVDIKYGLDAVLQTQPRSYKMNDIEGDFIGFVAQELQTVIPEVVSGDPEKQLGVDYGSLVAVAFKAIQELKTENNTLKSQLSDLETRIQTLESANV